MTIKSTRYLLPLTLLALIASVNGQSNSNSSYDDTGDTAGPDYGALKVIGIIAGLVAMLSCCYCQASKESRPKYPLNESYPDDLESNNEGTLRGPHSSWQPMSFTAHICECAINDNPCCEGLR